MAWNTQVRAILQETRRCLGEPRFPQDRYTIEKHRTAFSANIAPPSMKAHQYSNRSPFAYPNFPCPGVPSSLARLRQRNNLFAFAALVCLVLQPDYGSGTISAFAALVCLILQPNYGIGAVSLLLRQAVDVLDDRSSCFLSAPAVL